MKLQGSQKGGKCILLVKLVPREWAAVVVLKCVYRYFDILVKRLVYVSSS